MSQEIIINIWLGTVGWPGTSAFTKTTKIFNFKNLRKEKLIIIQITI